MLTILVFAAVFTLLSARESTPSVVFVILSQPSDFDDALATNLQQSLIQQANDTHLAIQIFISHIDFKDIYGAWTVSSLFRSLYDRLSGLSDYWLFLCEQSTEINLVELVRFLGAYNPAKAHFIGRGLADERPTIIHHFFGHDRPPDQPFLYPDFAGGVAISAALIKQAQSISVARRPTDFAIDPKHELSRMLFDLAGVSLTDAQRFCLLHNETNCITKFVEPTYENCGEIVSNEEVFFAVKTFSGYHKSRIVVVKRTWAKTAKYVEYFSNIRDPYVPTIDLGINNTERGHCGKTLAILKHFLAYDEVDSLKWLAVVDDDTLLSVPRLYRLLSCYSPLKNFIIGERYGYGFDADGQYGYDYPTGGAGMIFSRPAVHQIVNSCRCPGIDSPDDMIIGMCARRLSIPIIHSASFHQATPIDYSSLYLQRILPVSFHKFDDVDPYQVYMQRLHDHGTIPANRPRHSEL
ncbi:Beta-1,3-glucosyltransferase [Toxocara canis]|uniref:Beta-1,3-glucosyltransferase n=1 Tax=Toxocara canis TaxID=6265 RepID=A0A0B2VMS1_TOXCA|nr:Beta-1,3-glucosyltransferase [Toxocara canis]